MWKKVLFLFVLTALIESAFIAVYHYQATGPLAEPLASHSESLASGVIPTADEIDIHNDPWVKVAHFESSFGQVQLLVDMVVSLFIALFILLGGMSATIARKARALTPNIHLQHVLYLTMFVALYSAINIPLSFSNFIIGDLRGTSFVTADVAIFQFIQDFFLSILFTLIPFIPLYWIMDRYRQIWWVIGAAFFSLYSIFAAFVAPILIDPLYYDVYPLEDGPVMAALIDVVAAANVPTDRIFVADVSFYTFESNAMVTGLGGTKRIILDDTLLTFYTPEEIRNIVAHELGHYVYHHLWITMFITTILTFISFFVIAKLLRYILRCYGSRIGATQVSDIVLYPLLSTLLFLIPTITSPILSSANRSLEHQADVYEVRLTNDPQTSINSFKKMAYQSFIDVDPPQFLQFWFGTHPTTLERIEYFESQK